MTEKLKYKVGDKVLVEVYVDSIGGRDYRYGLVFSKTGEFISHFSEDGLDKVAVKFPPKPKIPQFVLDWCEAKRETGMIWNIARWLDTKDMPKAVSDWLFTGADLLLKQHALATLIAYGPKAVEVEKEKMYLVTLKSTGQLLARTADGFFFGTNDPYFKDSQYEFTKQELIEAGFEGVFDNPMFEVEGVE